MSLGALAGDSRAEEVLLAEVAEEVSLEAVLV